MPFQDIDQRPDATKLIMTDGGLMAQKGMATPPFYRTMARRANRSKRKVVYFAAGPALVIGLSAAGGPIGLGVGAGVVVGAVGAAVAGYVGYKIWRNARQAYSRRYGMKNFRLKLAEVDGLYSGRKANISSEVVNNVRFYLQKGSLGKLTDDFKFLVDKQIELHAQKQKPLNHCRDAMHLANLLYTVDHRRKGMMKDLENFETFYQWVLNEMSRCRFLLDKDKLSHILNDQIGRQADGGNHQNCRGTCYRLKADGKVLNPAISTMQFRSAKWKHDPDRRLMNDAMNLAYIGLHKSAMAYYDYQEEIDQLFAEVVGFADVSQYTRIDKPRHVLQRMKKSATAFAQGSGRSGAVAAGQYGGKGAGYALHVSVSQVPGLVPQTAVSLGAGAGIGAIGAVGSAAARSVGELINTSIELSRVKTPLNSQSAWDMIKEKSSRIDSLRALLKGGTFETAIDHFIKVRQRVEELEKIFGPDLNGPINNCGTAVDAAFNLLNAIKHWQAMVEPMRLVKEYAEILHAQSILHQDFLSVEDDIMNKVDIMVAAHSQQNRCWKYCKVVADEPIENN